MNDFKVENKEEPLLFIGFGENQEYKLLIDISKMNVLQKFILGLLGIKISKRSDK